MGISFSTSLIEGFGDRHFTEKNKKEKSEEERESGRKIEVSLLRQWRLGFSIDRPYRNLPPVPSLHLSPRPQNPNSKHFNSISAIFNSGSESCDGRAGKILRQFQFDAGAVNLSEVIGVIFLRQFHDLELETFEAFLSRFEVEQSLFQWEQFGILGSTESGFFAWGRKEAKEGIEDHFFVLILNHLKGKKPGRVKVYRLNDDGKWDDQGTGHVSVDYMERTEELGLFVIDEEDHETLLLHRISSEDIYRKQEETIISWRDPEYSTELALSFQETTGCSFIWDHICTVQRNLQFNNLSNLGAGSFLVNETMDASGATQVNGNLTTSLNGPDSILSPSPFCL
ncbi:Suppressor of Mek1 [Vitis vinifera]|uniref:Suppressor of Mek1 n=1 Tax=Vitis vinifera TaxID=29760 RepID=A0A438DWQ2_VITVI|nr:Suppressor of Mek1 [Vitis vinifera]